MKNILMVSIAFPPKNDPEALQTAKYVKYLSQISGIALDVVTSSNPTLFMPMDSKLQVYAKNVRQTIEIKLWENKYINFIIRKINSSWLDYPDIRFSFHWQANKVIRLLKHKPDIIYSRSYPISSTIMAYKLHQHYQVPWVLHLSDPWVENPIHSPTGKAKTWNEEMEKKCLEAASLVCLTSSKTIELYQNKYPHIANKFKLSPNVFDLADKVDVQMNFGDTLRLVYTGGLITDRSPIHLFKALEIIKQNHPEALKSIEIIFAGQCDRQNQALLDNSKFSCVKHIGLLSFPQALELQRTANILLVIDTPFKKTTEALFFPSKLLDYILAQRKILAITNLDSTSHQIVEGKYGQCFAHADAQGIADYLLQAIQAFQQKDESFFTPYPIDETYSAETCAANLNRLFHQLLES